MTWSLSLLNTCLLSALTFSGSWPLKMQDRATLLEHGGLRSYKVSLTRRLSDVNILIRVVRRGLTVGRVQRAFPKEASFGRPTWIEDDQGIGNAMRVSGRMSGVVFFQGPQNRKPVASDRVSQILIYLRDRPRYNTPMAAGNFAFCEHHLTTLFGQKAMVERIRTTNRNVSGRVAHWKFGGTLSGTLYEHWYGNGLTFVVQDTQKEKCINPLCQYRVRHSAIGGANSNQGGKRRESRCQHVRQTAFGPAIRRKKLLRLFRTRTTFLALPSSVIATQKPPS